MSTTYVGEWVLYALVSPLYALLCVVPASMKLSGTARMRHAAKQFGVPWSRYRLIGVLELIASIAAVVGIWWRPAGFVAAIGMTSLLIGAVIFHRRAGDTARDNVAALVFLAASAGYLAVGLSTHWVHQS